MNNDLHSGAPQTACSSCTICGLLTLGWLCATSVLTSHAAQRPPPINDRASTAVQRDFRIFDYYRETQRPKALLHGSIAYYLQHPVPIRGMTLTTYEATGETNLHAVAETCWIDRTNRVATSPDPVSFQFSGGRFQVKGVGFQWQQSGSILTVSNEVKSILRQDLFEPRRPSGKNPGASASVTTPWITPFDPPPFLQTSDPSTTMNAPSSLRSRDRASLLHRPLSWMLLTPWLATTAVLAAPAGTGFNALANPSPKTNSVTTTVAPAATPSPLTSATGTTPTLAAAPNKQSNPPSIQPRGNVAIHSKAVEYQGDIKKITYIQNVRVDDPAENPITTIECEWLSTLIPETRESLGEIIGLTNVVITFRGEKPDDRTVARGDRVVYNATNDTLVLTGVPASVDYASGVSLSTEGPIIYERKTGNFKAMGETKTVIRRSLAVPGNKPDKDNAAGTAAPPK